MFYAKIKARSVAGYQEKVMIRKTVALILLGGGGVSSAGLGVAQTLLQSGNDRRRVAVGNAAHRIARLLAPTFVFLALVGSVECRAAAAPEMATKVGELALGGPSPVGGGPLDLFPQPVFNRGDGFGGVFPPVSTLSQPMRDESRDQRAGGSDKGLNGPGLGQHADVASSWGSEITVAMVLVGIAGFLSIGVLLAVAAWGMDCLFDISAAFGRLRFRRDLWRENPGIDQLTEVLSISWESESGDSAECFDGAPHSPATPFSRRCRCGLPINPVIRFKDRMQLVVGGVVVLDTRTGQFPPKPLPDEPPASSH